MNPYSVPSQAELEAIEPEHSIRRAARLTDAAEWERVTAEGIPDWAAYDSARRARRHAMQRHIDSLYRANPTPGECGHFLRSNDEHGHYCCECGVSLPCS